MPAWTDAAVAEYVKRMPREAGLEVIEVRAEPRTQGAPAARAIQAEAKRIQAALPDGAFRVALDERGRGCTTRELAKRLERWQMEGRTVAFVIGGADGLPEDVRRAADWVWSLSALTLPHALARVIVAEQLYRATTILANHPYHRD